MLRDDAVVLVRHPSLGEGACYVVDHVERIAVVYFYGLFRAVVVGLAELDAVRLADG
ncbi:MAG: hypothetical protein ACPGVG_17195 [Mycobacterium sp.]